MPASRAVIWIGSGSAGPSGPVALAGPGVATQVHWFARCPKNSVPAGS